MNESPTNGRETGEVYLQDILKLFWFRRKFLMSVIGASLLAGVLFTVLQTPKYSAYLTLGPTEATVVGVSDLGGISGLVNLPSFMQSDTTPYDKFNSLLFSRSTAERLIACCKVLQEAFPENWDSQNGAWQYNPGVLSTIKRFSASFLGFEKSKEPTTFEFRDYLKENVKVKTVKGTQLITLSFQHKDKAFAEKLLRVLHRETDNLVRERLMIEDSEIVNYAKTSLESEVSSTNRQALISLVMEKERSLVLLRTSKDYAAAIVDDVAVDPNPSWPRPMLILFVSVFLSTCLACGYILWTDNLSKK